MRFWEQLINRLKLHLTSSSSAAARSALIELICNIFFSSLCLERDNMRGCKCQSHIGWGSICKSSLESFLSPSWHHIQLSLSVSSRKIQSHGQFRTTKCFPHRSTQHHRQWWRIFKSYWDLCLENWYNCWRRTKSFFNQNHAEISNVMLYVGFHR